MTAAIRAMLLVLIFAVGVNAWDKDLDFRWNYNKHIFTQLKGFKLYKGTTESSLPDLVADIPKEDVVVVYEKPILLIETFDQDPGQKYNVTQGSWKWISGTKNMKIESEDFMLVFEFPAGIENDFLFRFWPEKSTGDQPVIYSYIKDESLPAYYELRLAGEDGIRFSNWRKVYDSQFGGVEGAFALPRFKQCEIVEGEHNICPGFNVSLSWKPGSYIATVTGQKDADTIDEAQVSGEDIKPLDINKLEIITQAQHGWIDDIVIGGTMELGKVLRVSVPDNPVYFALSAYWERDGEIIESTPSIPLRYTFEETQPLTSPGGLRKIN